MTAHPVRLRHLPDRLELLAVALLAAVPTLATAWRASGEWRPVGDTAAITLRSSDVFTAASPLVGMPTTLSDSVGHVLHHPGPLEFWAIAAGQIVSSHRIVPMVAVVAVNLGAVLAMVAMAGWAAGRSGRVCAALLVGLCAWSLRGDYLIDPYNPYAAWLPLGAFAVAMVVLLHGRWWALPIAAAAGSYAAQSHVSLLVPVTVTTLFAIALAVAAGVRSAGGAPALLARMRAGVRAAEHRGPLVAGAAVLGVGWAPVLVDLLFGQQNVITLVRATGSDGPILGLARAWEVVARAVTSPPWLLADRSAFETVAPVGTLQQVLAAVVIAAMVALAAVHWRRGNLAVVAMIALALCGIGGGMLAASRIPGGIFAAYALHNYLWLWPFTALLWAGALLGAGLLVVERAEASHPATWIRAWSGPVTTGIVGLLIALAAVSALQEPVRASVLAGRHAPAVGSLGGQLGSLLDEATVVLIGVDAELDQSAVAMGLVLELERRGVSVRVPSGLEASFGSHRALDSGEADIELVVVVGRDGEPEVPAGAELIASYQPPTARTVELAQVNQAIVDRIRADGGLVVGIAAETVDDEAAVRMVRSGDLVGLGRLGLIVQPQIPTDEFRRYAEAQEGPILHVVVYRAE